jgi:hypothetical protein
VALPLAAHAQHTCVYCRSIAQSAPDPTATRLACTRNVNQSISCPVTGAMPDCDDQSLFQQVGEDLSDGCDSIEYNKLGSATYTSYDCVDNVRFGGMVWGLRAVITDPACPDPGSIWTECDYSTPLCQPRRGVASSQVQGGFQVAIENTTAAIQSAAVMMAPAPEQEMPAAAGAGAGAGVVGGGGGAAPVREMMPPSAPAPEMIPPTTVGAPQATGQSLPGVTTSTTPGGGLR